MRQLAARPWWRRAGVLTPVAAAVAVVLGAVLVTSTGGKQERPLAGAGPVATPTSDQAVQPAPSPGVGLVGAGQAPSPAQTGSARGVTPTAGQVPAANGDGPSPPPPAAAPAAAETTSGVTSVSPSEGPMRGGTRIELSGRGLSDVVRVEVGSRPASDVHVISDSKVSAVTPARRQAGWVDVVVVLRSGERYGVSPGFAYLVRPAVTALDPSSGTITGGNRVVITGSGFHARSAVSFGDTRATTVEVMSSTTIRVIAPPHLPGIVDVTVTTAGGTSAAGSGSRYTYAT